MKLNIFTSTTDDGIMSNEKKYFPNLTKEEREILYKNTLERYYKKYNINLENVFIIPKSSTQMKARTVTEKTKVIKEKILILKSKTPNLSVAVETIDEPIIVATVNLDNDESVSAIALGSIENLNDGLLFEIVEALMKETDAPPFEMTFYIGACPTKEEFELESIDKLTSPMWKDSIEKRKKKYYLDIKYAIFNQLISQIVDPNYIYFDTTSTVTDNKYFSKYKDKQGKNIITVVYTNE